MKKLILFLIRKRLGLKKGESFRFSNQKSESNFYFFDDDGIIRYDPVFNFAKYSDVSLNYLLSNECEIIKIEEGDLF